LEGLFAGIGVGGWEALDDKDYTVDEGRVKTVAEFLGDSLCFAALDAGCGLQMALGVKGVGKKRDNGGKDNSGEPEAAQVYRTHEVIRDRSKLMNVVRIHLRSGPVGDWNLLNWLEFALIEEAAIRISALLGLAATVLIGAPGLHAQDPRVGSWTLVSAQSALNPANKLSIMPLKDGVHVVMSGETHLDFTAKFDGHDVAAPGNLGFNQVELRKIDKRQSEVTEKKDGAVVATVRDKISSDGSELAVTTIKKGSTDQTTVWARSGGAKSADDMFAGEWTEDLGKTRMRQGLVMKIATDGSGTHFAWDYSYTARFDGKQYDVKNSRNDTVTLVQADAHTVDAVFRRDNQLAQTDRWVVSADGRQMTMSSTGTLETGQRVSEKLVFKKQ